MKIEQPGAAIQPGIGSRTTEGEFLHADVRLSAGEGSPPTPQTVQVKQEIEKEKEATLFAGSSLEFSVDTDTNRIVVKVVDNETRFRVVESKSIQDAIISAVLYRQSPAAYGA